MKTIKTLRTNALLIGATMIGLLFASAPAQAATIYQATNYVGTADWNTALWGTPLAPALAGNNYITGSTNLVQTFNTTAAQTFNGTTLQIDAGGILYLKHTLGTATVKLILNGGAMTWHGGPSVDACPVGGTLQVLTDSTIGSDQGAGNNRNVVLLSPISGSGGLTVSMGLSANVGNTLILRGTNTAYTGNWNNTSGRIEIGSGSSNALGSGIVSINQADYPLTFNTTNNLVVTNIIDGIGSISKLGTNTVTLTGNNSFSGSNVISGGTLKLGSATASSGASVIKLVNGTLDASLIGGLVLNAGIGQNLEGQGTIISNLTAASGNTLTFNLSAATNDVLNVTGSLTLSGSPTLNLTASGFKSSGTYRLINYSGTILGGGAFNLVPPLVTVQTYSLDYSTPGQVNLIIVGDPKNIVWVGDGSANYWDTTSLNWTNSNVSLTNFSLGDFVTFNDSGSTTPAIFITEPVDPSTVTVSNTVQPYVFNGSIGVSSAGVLTKAGSGDLVLDNNGNNFTGPIDIRAGMLSIGNGAATGDLGNPASITNNGLLRVNKLNGGTITINGTISGTGAIDVTGGAPFTAGVVVNLNGTNSYDGATTVGSGCQINFATATGLGSAVGGTTVLAGGRVGLQTVVPGGVSTSEPFTLNGDGNDYALNIEGALIVNGNNNLLNINGPVTLASSSRIRAWNVGTRMNLSNTVLGTNVNLTVAVGVSVSDVAAQVTFSNTVSMGTGALIKFGEGTAEFWGATNVFGSSTVNGGTLSVRSTFNGGPVTINASGTLAGSGTVLGPVSIANVGTLAPGNNSVNNGIGTLTVSNTVTLAANATTSMQINRTNPQNADLLVATAIPMNGVLNVVNTGPTNFVVGDTFNLFDGTISGAFTSMSLPTLPFPTLFWNTANLTSLGTIVVATNTTPLLPLIITGIQRSSTNVTLTWNSYPGRKYTVQYVTSLNNTNWATLKSDLSANGVTNTTTSNIDTTGVNSGLNNILVQYQMGTPTAQIQNSSNAMLAGDLTSPGFLGLFNPNANVTPAYASTPTLQAYPPPGNSTLALAFANSAWFTFDLTVGTNLTDLDLTSITLDGARGGGGTPRGCGIYVTTPTTTDQLVMPSTTFNTVRPTMSQYSSDWSGFASLQNLLPGQVITVKIPIFVPLATQSLEMDNITIRGNRTPRTITDYETASQLYLRILQQP